MVLWGGGGFYGGDVWLFDECAGGAAHLAFEFAHAEGDVVCGFDFV